MRIPAYSMILAIAFLSAIGVLVVVFALPVKGQYCDCGAPPTYCDGGYSCDYSTGTWVCGETPIIINPTGGAIELTDAEHGVDFDLRARGIMDRVAWTTVQTGAAWLVLDRDGNGLINSGRELFGNHTDQPPLQTGESYNGFRALAVFDSPANGGNANGRIDGGDAIFDRLRLWRDTNHNGISERDELQPLRSAGILAIGLDYHEARRADRYGNKFRYLARVFPAQKIDGPVWAWDVILKLIPAQSTPSTARRGPQRTIAAF